MQRLGCPSRSARTMKLNNKAEDSRSEHSNRQPSQFVAAPCSAVPARSIRAARRFLEAAAEGLRKTMEPAVLRMVSGAARATGQGRNMARNSVAIHGLDF